MTAAQARAFGGPLDDQWFPIGASGPVYLELDEELLEDAGPPASPMAPAPRPRTYVLRKFGAVDPDTRARWSGFAWLEDDASPDELVAGMRFVVALALLARGRR